MADEDPKLGEDEPSEAQDDLGRRAFLKQAAGFSAAVLGLLGGGAVTAAGCTNVRSEGDLCSNTCRDAYDGYCDDGGEGADYSICAHGTDCNDCGPRGTSYADSYSDYYANGYSDYYSNSYSDYYSNYSDYYSNYYSNYSDYYSDYYANYDDYFVNSW